MIASPAFVPVVQRSMAVPEESVVSAAAASVPPPATIENDTTVDGTP